MVQDVWEFERSRRIITHGAEERNSSAMPLAAETLGDGHHHQRIFESERSNPADPHHNVSGAGLNPDSGENRTAGTADVRRQPESQDEEVSPVLVGRGQGGQKLADVRTPTPGVRRQSKDAEARLKKTEGRGGGGSHLESVSPVLVGSGPRGQMLVGKDVEAAEGQRVFSHGRPESTPVPPLLLDNCGLGFKGFSVQVAVHVACNTTSLHVARAHALLNSYSRAFGSSAVSRL
jgi:hypothetical protein